ELEKEWLRINPSIRDIYTLRRLAADQIVTVVDSENPNTDSSDGSDGSADRVSLGREWQRKSAQLDLALDGVATFDDVSLTDPRSAVVSGYAPLFDAEGRVDGVIGVDFQASDWAAALLWARSSVLGFATILVGTVLGATCVTSWLNADI